MTLTLQQKLLDWFAENKRVLPWRSDRTPYRVWISEIMLQQTRVETVIPYYLRWLAAFPDIQSLAKAGQQDVLRLWEGLGYYSRARSLHRTAQIIVSEYDGVFPSDRKILERLPGIGRYTAGAIASIAFNQAVPALDGNIRRIYARLFDVDQPLGSKEAEKIFWNLAEEQLAGQDQPGTYHEALMDLGATVCQPTHPECGICPVIEYCQAYSKGIIENRPLILPKAAIPHHTVTAAIIHDAIGRVLIAQRPAKGLLAGLWEFPGGKQEQQESLEECLIREIQEELKVQVIIKAPYGIYKHAYTHFRVTLHAFLCEIGDQKPEAVEAQDIRWAGIPELSKFPMGKIDRQIANKLQEKNQD